MHPVRLAVQRLDKLGVDHADQIIQRLIRIRNAAEQSDFAFAQFLQMQFIRHRQFGDSRQVECGKAHTYTYQNRLRRFACRLLKDAILFASNAVGFAHLQTLEQDVQRGLEVVVILMDFGGSDHLHHHREVLFFGQSFVQQVQHKGLQQGGFGLGPERIVALRMGWRGVLNQIFNQGQHFTVIMHIDKRVVTERCSRVDKVKDNYFIALLPQQITGLTQNFGLWICNYHRAGTFQYIRHTIGARLACAGAADNEDVRVMLVFVAIYPDVKVLRQQQIRPVLVHVELV